MSPTVIPNVAPYMPLHPPQMNGHQQPSYFPPVPTPTVEVPPASASHGSGLVNNNTSGATLAPTPSPPQLQVQARQPPPRAKPPSRLVRHTAPNPNSVANGNSKEISERNQLNLAKIEDGQDTRTTIMIKNIPNKMTDKDLIAYIHKVIPRRIDFLYLRMDFSNGTLFELVSFSLSILMTMVFDSRLQCRLRICEFYHCPRHVDFRKEETRAEMVRHILLTVTSTCEF
jgi:hypothetical protein